MYPPADRMITLFGTAAESTFVHESGHYFLDVMTDVVMRSDAPEQVRADIQTLMDWFGLKDLEEWNGLSLEEKRQFHEQFARGFEQLHRPPGWKRSSSSSRTGSCRSTNRPQT